MDDKSPIKVTSTGAGAKGFFKAIVEALHGIYRDAYPGSSATFKPSGVAGGIAAVANGKGDIAMAIPPVELQHALAGEPPFRAPLKGKIFHLITILDNVDFYFIATKAWADRNRIKTLGDVGRIKAKTRLALNRKGVLYSNTGAMELFKSMGFSVKDIGTWGGQITWNASGPSLKDVRDGKIDLMIHGGFHPDARIVDLSKARELVWIPSDRAALAKVAGKLGMKVVRMPAGTYPFQRDDIATLRAPIAMGAGAHVSDEVAYKVVKAVAENIDRVRVIHRAFKNFSLEQMASRHAALAYHPGALKYYREKDVAN